jgi:hypothetical protein
MARPGRKLSSHVIWLPLLATVAGASPPPSDLNPQASQSERAQVDRIEAGRAVLLLGPDGGEMVSLPVRLLPPGAREGASFELTVAPASAETGREDVRGLLDDVMKPQAYSSDFR